MVLKNLAVLALAALAASPLAAAATAGERRVWTLSDLSKKTPAPVYLGYGVPETDDSLGDFRCQPGSGVVTLFVAATDGRLRPGRKATAILSAGEARARIAGRLRPNEEAGVPSFEGRLGAADPIFAALAGGGMMIVVVGPSRQSAPLDGAQEKFRKFLAACARP